MYFARCVFVVYVTLWAVSCNPIVGAKDKVMVSDTISTYEEKDGVESFQEVLVHFQNSKFRAHAHNIVSYGISDFSHWVTFEQFFDAGTEYYIECPSGVVDEMQMYLLDENNQVLQADTLVWNLSIELRDVKSLRNAFPVLLGKSGKYRVFFKVVKRNGSLQLPFFIWAVDSFYRSQQQRSLYFGFVMGVFCIITLLSISIYFNLKEPKFLYYGLYIFFICVWRLWVEGFVLELFETQIPDFLYPYYANFPMVIGVCFMMLFYREFVLKSLNPIPKWAWYAVTGLVVVEAILSCFTFVSRGSFILSYVLYYLYYFTAILNLLALLLSLFLAVLKRSQNAWIYLVSSFPFVLYAIVAILANNGIVSHSIRIYDHFLWTIFFEVCILTIALGVEFKNLMLHRQLLSREVKLKQEEMHAKDMQLRFEQIKRLEAQNALKTEKERLSRDLHDSLGTELSNIIYNLDYLYLVIKKRGDDALTMKLQNLQSYTRKSMQQLRNAIWVLHQQSICVDEFVSKTHTYVLDQIGEERDMLYGFSLDEEIKNISLPSLYVLNLFRVTQEALSNILKYSEATSIHISWHLDVESDIVVYKICDDGKGIAFQDMNKENSYGLKNINARISELGEEVKINASENGGTEICILLTKLRDQKL